jgi:hypothetical protein
VLLVIIATQFKMPQIEVVKRFLKNEQPVKDQIEEHVSVTLFKYVPLNGWPDEPICSSN